MTNEAKNADRNRFPGRIRYLENAARQVLGEVFGSGRPADRAVAGFFHDHRQCGSRDRALIGQGVYALLRYWGWLRRFLPGERRAELESGEIRLSALELRALLYAGLVCDGLAPEAAEALRCELKIPGLRGDPGSPLRRAVELARLFGVEAGLELDDLAPEWVRDAVPPDFDYAAFTRMLARRPPLWLRIQRDPDRVTSELAAAGLRLETGRLPGSLAVRGDRLNLFNLEGYRNGDFEVQDLASQCIGAAAAPKPGERWFDPCAGAGGKSLQLASLMKNRGTVVAGDVRDYILDELRRRSRRSGFSNISTRVHDGRPWRGLKPFDGVLVDAPCSCSGVWRRHPGSQWRFSPAEIPGFAARQLEILTNFSAAVKPGGVLVYATCSIFTAENEAVVHRFLGSREQFKLDPFPHPLTGTVVPGMTRISAADGDCDSMFVARLRCFA